VTPSCWNIQIGRRAVGLSSHGTGKETALGGHEDAVGIARAEDERAVVYVLAPDVEVHHREGKARALGDRLLGVAARHALAARLAVQVGGDGADGRDLGVLEEPVHRMTCGR
jgi:hypothetical protein